MKIWFSNLSIKSKLLLLSTAVSFIVLTAFSISLYNYGKFSAYKERESSASRLAEIASKNLTAAIAFSDLAVIKESLTIVSSDKDFLGAIVLDEKNQSIFQSSQIESYSEGVNKIKFETLDPDIKINRQEDRFVLEVLINLNKQYAGKILMFFSYQSVKDKISELSSAIILCICFALILGSLVSMRLQGIITNRLLNILDIIKKISASRDYTLVIDKMGTDEIGILVQNFNLMLSEIGQRDLSLRLANLSLESRVQERTRELEVAIKNLEDAQTQIYNKHGQLLSLVSNAPTAMAMFDQHKNLIVYSHKWVELFGLSKDSQTDRQISLYFPESWEYAFDQSLKGETQSANEDYFRSADKQVVFIRWTIQPWLNNDQQVGGVIIAAEDIGDLVKARDAAIKVAKTRTEFMANVSHELRTPLNGIIGFASILQDSNLDPEQKEHVDLIRASGEILLKTINDVLDFSKLERGNSDLERLSFSARGLMLDLQKLFSSVAGLRGNKVLCLIEESVPERVIGDEFRLRQILTNLVGNANKFTEKGDVKLALQIISLEKDLCKLKFSVEDSGVGIPEDKIQEIFKPFSQADGSVTRKYGGTGLGLSIASSLVSLMGGELKATSQIGKGSNFYFEVTLPVDTNYKKTEDLNSANKIVSATLLGKRILLAEDNPINLKLVKKILDKSGCEIIAVEDGEKAVSAFNDSGFDVVILDMQMPVMGGIEACRLIRQNTKRNGNEVPIVALTAHAFDEDKLKCFEAGMNSFITKPIDKSELINTISDLISQKIK